MPNRERPILLSKNSEISKSQPTLHNFSLDHQATTL